MDTLAGLLFLATFVEGTLEYTLGEDKYKSRPWIRYVALAVGAVVAVAYRVSIPELIGLSSPIQYVDYVVTGVIIGRGSNYLNDIVGAFRKS